MQASPCTWPGRIHTRRRPRKIDNKRSRLDTRRRPGRDVHSQRVVVFLCPRQTWRAGLSLAVLAYKKRHIPVLGPQAPLTLDSSRTLGVASPLPLSFVLPSTHHVLHQDCRHPRPRCDCIGSKHPSCGQRYVRLVHRVVVHRLRSCHDQ